MVFIKMVDCRSEETGDLQHFRADKQVMQIGRRKGLAVDNQLGPCVECGQQPHGLDNQYGYCNQQKGIPHGKQCVAMHDGAGYRNDGQHPFGFVQGVKNQTANTQTNRHRNAGRLEFQPGLQETDATHNTYPDKGAG